jgi:hypothetical protein
MTRYLLCACLYLLTALPTAAIGFPNFRPDWVAGWDYPLVPHHTNQVIDGSVHLTADLQGNSDNTYFSSTGINDGPDPAANDFTSYSLDGVPFWYSSWYSIAAGQRYFVLNQGPITVRGGRHALRWRNDYTGTVPETNEADNDFARQFVWTPWPLSEANSLSRPAPPDPGFSDGFAWPNCDGFELHWQDWWGAVGVLAASSSADYDIRLHNDPVSPENGFDTYEVTSNYGANTSDFVLVCGRSIGRVSGERQVGVWNYNGGSADFAINISNGYHVLAAPGMLGTFPLGEYGVVKFVEIYFAGTGEYVFRLDQVWGAMNLGFSLFAPGATHYAKSSYVASADAHGDGAGEEFTYWVPAPGYYGLVVWKSTSSDYGKSGGFNVSVTEPTISAASGLSLPERLIVHQNSPNPFNPTTHIRYDVPAPGGQLRMDLFDMEGRRVRVLLDAACPAGRHEITWDGRDDRGRPLPSGVYLYRIISGGSSDARRLILLK